MYLFKKLGKLTLILCEQLNSNENEQLNSNENEQLNSNENEQLNSNENEQLNFVKFNNFTKFDIHNYIDNLLIDTNIYKYFNKFKLLKEKVINYNLKFRINYGKISYFNMKLKYNMILINLKYAIIPDQVFDKKIIVKIETYFSDDMNIYINNKINEQIIYYSNNSIIYIIIEYIFSINQNIIFYNYNIEIDQKNILFIRED
jgi:hypothetical protein